MKKLTEASKHIILSILAATFVLLMIMAVSQLAHASKDGGGDGDKVNNPWQNVDEDACALFTPSVLTSEKCVDDPGGVSGQDYLCTFPAVCPDGIAEPEDD